MTEYKYVYNGVHIELLREFLEENNIEYTDYRSNVQFISDMDINDIVYAISDKVTLPIYYSDIIESLYDTDFVYRYVNIAMVSEPYNNLYDIVLCALSEKIKDDIMNGFTSF